jgi:hypothetical protein
MEITGRVKELLQEQSGQGKNGTWRKQEFVLETEGEYPKQVCIVQWGDNIDRFGIQAGETITAHIDVQSREYNGRWYTDVKAWKIERAETNAAAAPPSDEPWPEPPAGGSDDGLPF